MSRQGLLECRSPDSSRPVSTARPAGRHWRARSRCVHSPTAWRALRCKARFWVEEASRADGHGHGAPPKAPGDPFLCAPSPEGSVLNVEMTAEARELTFLKTAPCELTHVAYLHIENTLHRMDTAALRIRPVVLPRHSVGRPAHRPAATDCRSPGSAWPTGPRSGHRLASAVQARVGTLDTRG